MPYSKKWYTSKTVWINSLVIVASLSEVLREWLMAGDFSAVGATVLVTGVVNLALRFVTSESIQ
jgi:hypothetical protein